MASSFSFYHSAGAEGGVPFSEGLKGIALPKRATFLGSRYGKGVPFSGWRYVKGVSFQGKVYERGIFSRKGM